MITEESSQSINKDLGQEFWDAQYRAQSFGWDLGEVSPPLKAYIDQLADKNLRILIPGCGNSYEAEYLLQQGFKNITVIDIAPTLVAQLQEKFIENPHLKVILADFFEHDGEYDLILEQTFFCALNPALRHQYVNKMNTLLKGGGKIAGVLFRTEFEKEGPPFGGTKSQYEKMFSKQFTLDVFDDCYNSFHKRAGNELFILLKK